MIHFPHPLYVEKPIVSPMSFPSDLTEGMQVILTCNVLSGDSPISFQWTKDGSPLNDQALGIDETRMGDLGSVLVFRDIDRKHTGNYSCIVKNNAGETRSTAEMTVKGI